MPRPVTHRILKQRGSFGWMSHRGNPYGMYGNAQAESLMKPLQIEAARAAEYATLHDVTADLPNSIDNIYNAG